MPSGTTPPSDSIKAIGLDLHERALAARKASRYSEAYDIFGQLAIMARKYGPAEYLAWVLRSWGEAAVFTGNYDVATPALKEAVALCECHGDGAGHAHCIFLIGQIAAHQGRAEEANHFFKRSGELAQKAGDQAGVAVALRAQGEVAAARYKPEDAAALLFKARRIFVEIGDKYGEASTLQGIARVEAKLGRIQSAQKCLEDALALANALGEAQIRASVHFDVGMFCAEWRGAESAEAALDVALAAYEESGDRLGKARCLSRLAIAYFRQRRYDEAAKSLEICRALFVELGHVAEAAIASMQMADVLVACGKYADAAVICRDQIGILRRHGSVANQGEALLGLGNALGRGGDLTAARDCFAEARGLFARIKDRSNLAHSDMIEGEILVRLGRETEGAALIGRGSDTYDALGVLGDESPKTVAEKKLARIKKQIAETHSCS